MDEGHGLPRLVRGFNGRCFLKPRKACGTTHTSASIVKYYGQAHPAKNMLLTSAIRTIVETIRKTTSQCGPGCYGQLGQFQLSCSPAPTRFNPSSRRSHSVRTRRFADNL